MFSFPSRAISQARAAAPVPLRRALLLLAMMLSGCDQLGIESPQKATERVQADAKAIGGACRHALRAIEDCYTLNAKAEKSSVYAGWREMDEYMRENKLEGVAPVVPRPVPGAASAAVKPASEDEDTEEPEVPPKKGAAKASPKGH
jgi:hypothetical protein